MLGVVQGVAVLDSVLGCLLSPGLAPPGQQPVLHSCLRPVAGDDVPLVGRTLAPNLWVNTGHGSKVNIALLN